VSKPLETVVLTLGKVVFRHTEYVQLSDFLIKKYGFTTIEEVDHGISETREVTQIDRGGVVVHEESKTPIVIEEVGKKTSSHKVYEGNHMDAKIRIHFLGDIMQTESLMEISNEEKYKVYTAEYQMIKLESDSGYSLQQFLEKIVGELGLSVGSQGWSFHRDPGT
jgi:hypothetical protein